MIILDTHIWVNWILQGESGLTKPILAAMNSQPSMAVSAISCFEVTLLVKQRKLELPLPTEEWLVEALSASGVECLPVTCEISRLSVALQDIHKDPADIRQLWAAEARARRDDVRNGLVKTVPGQEALDRVRKSVSRCGSSQVGRKSGFIVPSAGCLAFGG